MSTYIPQFYVHVITFPCHSLNAAQLISVINSSSPSTPYIRQWNGWSLVQVMACRLFGAKPLPKPMLLYCQLDSWEQVSVKFESEFCYFHSIKCILKWCLPKWRPFCPGGRWVKGRSQAAYKSPHTQGTLVDLGLKFTSFGKISVLYLTITTRPGRKPSVKWNMNFRK